VQVSWGRGEDFTSGNSKDFEDFVEGVVGLVISGFERAGGGWEGFLGTVEEVAAGEGSAQALVEKVSLRSTRGPRTSTRK